MSNHRDPIEFFMAAVAVFDQRHDQEWKSFLCPMSMDTVRAIRDEIVRLRAEIGRLQAALREIADVPATLENKIDIARRALEGKE